MRTVLLILIMGASANAQQLLSAQPDKSQREAESILIASCRVVSERLAIPMPDPKVELKVGDRTDAVDSYEGVHVIHLRRWNRALFKRAAVDVCIRAAESELVTALVEKVRDY